MMEGLADDAAGAEHQAHPGHGQILRSQVARGATRSRIIYSSFVVDRHLHGL
jgi:hypothetical protein